MMLDSPLLVGSVVTIGHDNYEIAAVGWIGERYYWLVAADGSVAMLPAVCVELGIVKVV